MYHLIDFKRKAFKMHMILIAFAISVRNDMGFYR